MKVFHRLQLFTLLLLLAAPVVRGQQQPANDAQSGATTPLPPLPPEGSATSNPPAPAASGIFLGSGGSAVEASPAVPDTHSLSDSEAFGLGSPLGPHNVFSPAVFFTGGVDNGYLSAGTTNWFTTVGGSVALDRVWRRYDFSLAYSGGFSFYRPASGFDYSYHNLGISQTITWPRWTLRLNDALTYTPQGTFGGLPLGGPGMMGFQLPTGLLPSASPGQTILTEFARRLQESAAGDLDYQLSPHGVLTFSGSGGLLHFFDASFIDSVFASGRAGYSYQLNPKDSIGLTYVYSQNNFTAFSDYFRAHSIQASYGRKVTGKLAFQVAAGPEYVDLYFFGAPTPITQWTWSAFAALSYHWLRTDLTVSYSHTLSTGSGVFLGSLADVVSGTVNRHITPNWSGSLGAGYSRNNNLAAVPNLANQFDLVTGSASLTRLLGRSFDVVFGYGLAYQTTSGGICPIAGACNTFGHVSNIGSVTIHWHLVPIRFGSDSFAMALPRDPFIQ